MNMINENEKSLPDEKIKPEDILDVTNGIEPVNALIYSDLPSSQELNTINENEKSAPDETMKVVADDDDDDDGDDDDDDEDDDEAEKYKVKGWPLYTIEVGGIGPVNNVLIDSGFNICVISRQVLTASIVSKMKPSFFFTKVGLLDKSDMDILGCVDLRVSYLGNIVEMCFYVVAELCVRLVLGANWIMKSGATLQSDGTELRVTFGGKKDKFWSKWFCYRPFVSVDVDGIGLVKALVDTGANKSFIRRKLLTDLQISKIVPTSNRIIVGDGKISQEKIENFIGLNVTHHKITTCIENVSVVSNMCSPLILGMDWIHKTRIVIKSDGWKLIASQPDDLQSKPKKNNRLVSYLSGKWNSTFGSVSRISSLVSNLM